MQQQSEDDPALSCRPTPHNPGVAPELSVERLVHAIAEALVRHKDRIQVLSRQDERGTTLILKVAPEDLPRLLNGKVRTLDSMRTLVQSVGMRQQRRVSLHIAANDE